MCRKIVDNLLRCEAREVVFAISKSNYCPLFPQSGFLPPFMFRQKHFCPLPPLGGF